MWSYPFKYIESESKILSIWFSIDPVQGFHQYSNPNTGENEIIQRNKRSYFTADEDKILLRIKIVSSILADGILGIRYVFNHCNDLWFNYPFERSDWLKTGGSYPYCSTNAKPVNRNENCWASTVIPTTLIRDFLHEYSDISLDKARFQF